MATSLASIKGVPVRILTLRFSKVRKVELMLISGEINVGLAYNFQRGVSISLASRLGNGFDIFAETVNRRYMNHITGGTAVDGDPGRVMVVEGVEIWRLTHLC